MELTSRNGNHLTKIFTFISREKLSSNDPSRGSMDVVIDGRRLKVYLCDTEELDLG
jgi:hypothetical protein